jgi:hypothetical protein
VEAIFPRFARDRFFLVTSHAILAPPEGIVETGDQLPFAVRVTWEAASQDAPERKPFVREINRQKNNMEGLLGLVHYSDPTEPLVPSTAHANTFGHFGVIVPDIPAAQARFEKLGVNFIKKAGEAAKLEGPTAESYELGAVYERDPVEAEELYQAVLAPGLMDFALLRGTGL